MHSDQQNKLSTLGTMMLFMFLLLANLSVLAQQRVTDIAGNNAYFILESIPGKYDLIKAVYSDYELLMRPSSIDYLSTPIDGEEESLTFVFRNSNKTATLEGQEEISREVLPIPNKAMAAVLGVDKMSVVKYKKLIYKELYDGVDVEVSVATDGLSFKLLTDDQAAATAFNLGLLGGVNPQEDISKNTISLPHKNRSIQLSAPQSRLSYSDKNRGFELEPSTNNEAPIKFGLSIKQ